MEDDIYRGQLEVPPAPVSIAESVAAPSAASSSGSLIAGRLGALAAVVEHAITRWARSRRLASSSASVLSQSSTTSSASSIYAPSRPRLTGRRQRRSSSANARSIHSEREVAARLRARKKIQRVDRGFTLYIPPNSNPEVAATTQILDTFGRTEQSLHVILDRLEAALKKTSRRKVKGKRRQHSLGLPPFSLHNDFISASMPPRPASFTDLSTLRSSIQGKQRKCSQGTSAHSKSTLGDTHVFNRAPKAWWLDVASPTWDDLQNIGKVRTPKVQVYCADFMNSFCTFILLHLRIFSSKIRARRWSRLRSLVIILFHSVLYRMQSSPRQSISKIPMIPMLIRLTTMLYENLTYTWWCSRKVSAP